jgi:hypothetical protein
MTPAPRLWSTSGSSSSAESASSSRAPSERATRRCSTSRASSWRRALPRLDSARSTASRWPCSRCVLALALADCLRRGAGAGGGDRLKEDAGDRPLDPLAAERLAGGVSVKEHVAAHAGIAGHVAVPARIGDLHPRGRRRRRRLDGRGQEPLASLLPRTPQRPLRDVRPRDRDPGHPARSCGTLGSGISRGPADRPDSAR